ncbi:hypothetical protein FRC06_001546 [Ceratobasidium sp. 370]|nr:hypothetical protein FRC06_001546 [Ceratobasidium sp. 370]
MISFSQPSISQMITSAFNVPSVTLGNLVPPPSNTVTTLPGGGLHGAALAGAIVGGILGAVGLLGIGVFLMRSFGGSNHAADLFGGPNGGGYERASGGDGGGGGGGGGGSSSGGMSEVRNEGPERRSSLRNPLPGGGYDNGPSSSWAPYAYAGAAAAGAMASTQQHRRGQDSNANANARYADGGIRDEDTPDGQPGQMRYGDGGLAGHDSQYDVGASYMQGPAGDQYMHDGDHYFQPYRDLPFEDGAVAGAGGQGDVFAGFAGSNNAGDGSGPDQPGSQYRQQDSSGGVPSGQDYASNGPFGDTRAGPSLGDGAAGGTGTDVPYQQQGSQVPYWEPDGDAPAYMPGYDTNQPFTDILGDAGTGGTGSQWNLLDEMQFGQASSSADVGASTSLADPGMADAPKGLHQALERMGTSSTRARSSSRGESPFYMAGEVGATVRPLRVVGKVGGPRTKPTSPTKSLSPEGPNAPPPYAD